MLAEDQAAATCPHECRNQYDLCLIALTGDVFEPQLCLPRNILEADLVYVARRSIVSPFARKADSPHFAPRGIYLQERLYL